MRFIKIKITDNNKNHDTIVLDELAHFSAALVDEQSDRRFVQELEEKLSFHRMNRNKT